MILWKTLWMTVYIKWMKLNDTMDGSGDDTTDDGCYYGCQWMIWMIFDDTVDDGG